MKIKKYFLLVLILIAFAGLLSPVAQVQADTPYEQCVANALIEFEGDYQAAQRECGSPYADACADLEGIGKIICQIHKILNLIIPTLIALGVIYFIWGVVQYVIRDSEEAKKKGKNHIIYGLIGLAIIVGLWGVTNIVVKTFGLGGGSAPDLSSLSSDQPAGACADELPDAAKFQDILDYATCIIYKSVVPVIFALAVVMFIWGVTQFVLNSSDEAKKEKGRQFMLWGVIALAVMISVWGMVNIVTSTFGVEDPFIPQVAPR